MTLPLPPTPVLETERLILRPIELADAPAVQRRFPQWSVVQWLNAQIPWPYPADGAETHIRECLEAQARGEKFYWAIAMKAEPGDAIGLIDLWPDDGQGSDMRAFWLDPAFQGQGLMTEAADRVTAYALEELGWPFIVASNAEPNAASARIKAKQGGRILSRAPGRFCGGEAVRVTWRIDREAWLARERR